MATRLLKIPSDLSFQKTYDGFRSPWWCKEYTCERYPDLRIRTHGRAGKPEIVQYTVLDSNHDPHGFPRLKSAYTFLMSRPRRVVRDQNIKRRDVDGYSSRRKAALNVLKKTGGRSRSFRR